MEIIVVPMLDAKGTYLNITGYLKDAKFVHLTNAVVESGTSLSGEIAVDKLPAIITELQAIMVTLTKFNEQEWTVDK